jgi:hypothetical protein
MLHSTQTPGPELQATGYRLQAWSYGLRATGYRPPFEVLKIYRPIQYLAFEVLK